MKILVISDYVSSRLFAAQRQREKLLDASLANYKKTFELRRTRLEALKARTKKAWLEFNLAKGFFLSVYFALVLVFTRKPAKPKPLPLSVSEAKWQTGKAGEVVLKRYLASFLDNSWTLITGIKTKKGELDAFLVGPKGLFAFEVKTRKGIISAKGDTWILDKYDNYGKLVESDIPITDNAGRSPSRQLNEAADALYEAMPPSCRTTAIHRILVFPHPKANLGYLSGLTVDLVICSRNHALLQKYIQSKDDLQLPLEKIVLAFSRQ